MDVLKRIRRALALAQSDNVNEAANAAALAQSLMLEHKIEMADLALNGEKAAPEEVIEASVEGNRMTRAKASRWRISLADRIARVFHCKVYFNTGTDHIGVMGHVSNVQATQYLQQYLSLEIQRLCEMGWAAIKASAAQAEREGGLPVELPRATVWKNSFRDGAVHAVGEKLSREALKNRIRMGEASPVNNPVLCATLKAEIEAEVADTTGESASLVASTEAMILVRTGEEEQEREMESKWQEHFHNPRTGRSRLRSTSWSPTRHSHDGYGAGKAAGSGITINGAKGAIRGSSARLEG